MRDIQSLADTVLLAIKAAQAPLLERLSSAEAMVKDLQERLADVPVMRDRLVTLEEKHHALAVMTANKSGPSAAAIELQYINQVRPIEQEVSLVRERLAAVEARAPVPGPPGEVGAPGRDGTPVDVEHTVMQQMQPWWKDVGELRERVAVVEARPQVPGPQGEKGDPGVDGKPGLSFKDVYKDGSTYNHGDIVTWDGSWWHCNNDATTNIKPGSGSKDWTLAVKHGRDGRDGKDAATVPVVSVMATRP